MENSIKLPTNKGLPELLSSYISLDVSSFAVKLKFYFSRFHFYIFTLFYPFLSYASNIADSNIFSKGVYCE